MIYKTLVKRNTGEFALVMEGEVYTTETPQMFPATATIKEFGMYMKSVEGVEVDMSDLEFVLVELKKI